MGEGVHAMLQRPAWVALCAQQILFIERETCTARPRKKVAMVPHVVPHMYYWHVRNECEALKHRVNWLHFSTLLRLAWCFTHWALGWGG